MTTGTPHEHSAPPDSDANHARLLRELDLATKQAELAQKKASTKGTWATTASVLVGIVVTAAAFLGVKFNSAQDTVSSQDGVINDQSATIATLQRERAGLQAANNGLASDNADLNSQVSSMSSQLAATSSAPPSAAQSSVQAPATAGSIYHQGNIELANGGDHINLLAPPSDPKWGEKPGDPVESNYMGYYPGVLTIWYVALAEAPSGKAADFATCSSLTTYKSDSYSRLDVSQLSDAPTQCLRLSNDRYATLRLLGQEGDNITLEITVWNS